MIAPVIRWLGALLLMYACVVLSSPQDRAQQPTMDDDARRMHEQLLALRQGDGDASMLRIEFMDSRGLSAHRSFALEDGRLTSKEWSAPGAPMIRREGGVSDGRVVELLDDLITNEYWTFQGTRFVPDAPTFLFRFIYADLSPVDFRCDLTELERSRHRTTIRDLFLTFAANTEMTVVSEE